MKSMNLASHLTIILGICATGLGPATLQAAPGYLTDSVGAVVSDSSAACVKTGSWTSSLGSPACDAALAARLEAERLAAEQARLAANLNKLKSPAAIKKPALVSFSDSGNVMFEFNSAVLTPAATGELDKLVDKISGYDQVEGIRITGHTDSTGPERYNQNLSEQRAASVGDYLASHGIQTRLLTVGGMGETSPVVENTTREGRARNRRVDILISGSNEE